MRNLLIKNALTVTESLEEILDVLVTGEIIKAVGKIPPQSGWELIDGAGKILVPGGVDAHTRFCLDTGSALASDDFYTGTRAAVWGGTTSVLSKSV